MGAGPRRVHGSTGPCLSGDQARYRRPGDIRLGLADHPVRSGRVDAHPVPQVIAQLVVAHTFSSGTRLAGYTCRLTLLPTRARSPGWYCSTASPRMRSRTCPASRASTLKPDGSPPARPDGRTVNG